jgi:hypothetical protein
MFFNSYISYFQFSIFLDFLHELMTLTQGTVRYEIVGVENRLEVRKRSEFANNT